MSYDRWRLNNFSGRVVSANFYSNLKLFHRHFLIVQLSLHTLNYIIPFVQIFLYYKLLYHTYILSTLFELFLLLWLWTGPLSTMRQLVDTFSAWRLWCPAVPALMPLTIGGALLCTTLLLLIWTGGMHIYTNSHICDFLLQDSVKKWIWLWVCKNKRILRFQ